MESLHVSTSFLHKQDLSRTLLLCWCGNALIFAVGLMSLLFHLLPDRYQTPSMTVKHGLFLLEVGVALLVFFLQRPGALTLALLWLFTVLVGTMLQWVVACWLFHHLGVVPVGPGTATLLLLGTSLVSTWFVRRDIGGRTA